MYLHNFFKDCLFYFLSTCKWCCCYADTSGPGRSLQHTAGSGACWTFQPASDGTWGLHLGDIPSQRKVSPCSKSKKYILNFNIFDYKIYVLRNSEQASSLKPYIIWSDIPRTWNDECSCVRKLVLVPRVRIRRSAIVMSISSPRIISAWVINIYL